MASIELNGVTYRYIKGGVEHISFTVPEGKIHCLLGPSGSGKTTLLRLIAGFLRPQAGSIRLGDVTVADAAHHLPPQKRRVGLVFQQHALFPHLTVAANILFGCPHRQKEKRQDVLHKLLADFHIAQHQAHYPHQLSGGEQQRVALARAIASEPRILLLDEPFASLDRAMREQVQQQCLEVIRMRGLTALLVTHDEADAERMGDGLIRLGKPV